MTSFFWLIRKEILTEWRTKEVFLGALMFGLIVFAFFHFAFSDLASSLAAGAYWFAVFFGGLLGLVRLHEREVSQGGLDLLRLSRVSGAELFAAKTLSLLIILMGVELFLVGPLILFFDLQELSFLWLGQWSLLALLGGLGFAVVGSMMTAVAARTEASELILPLLILPILSPLFIGVTEVGAHLIQPTDGGYGSWLKLIVVFDLVMGVCSWWLYEIALETN